MVAGMVRHMNSLRTMKRDHGWIHTLLEEAENERYYYISFHHNHHTTISNIILFHLDILLFDRMHLLTFIQLKNPSLFFRGCVIVSQGIFMNAFFIAYFIHPRICHRFVGYLEEEAVKTYTEILSAIDDGRLAEWKTRKCPPIAMDYWNLGSEGTMRDMILAIRADEANHRNVNHTFADLKATDDNPNLNHQS